jgi:DNA repair protein RecO (recombination protein O)
MPPQRLMSGFYLNELLLRLTHRDEAVREIFDLYALTLETLRLGGPEEATLRAFEHRLLEHLGYGLDTSRDAASGEPLAAERYYHFLPGIGLRAAGPEEDPETAFLGAHLIGLASGRFESPEALRAAKLLLRAALAHSLEGRGLRSRDVMLALRRLEADR